MEITDVPSSLWGGCLPVWKTERQCKRPVSKGTAVANLFLSSLENVYASHFEVSDTGTLVQMSSRNRMNK